MVSDHLRLEDFTVGMKYPCVMDIKIGKDRHYPGRAKEKSKQDAVSLIYITNPTLI